MHMMTVNELLTLISKKEEDFRFYYEYLDFFHGNEHIQNPNNHQKEHYKNNNHRNEQNFLKGDEIVYGDYLLYYSCGHDGSEYIYSCGSLNEMSEHITWSYPNSFCTDMKAIVNGKIKPFVVKGYDRQANLYTHEKWGNDDFFLFELTRKWVEWLDEEKELDEMEKEIQHDTPLMMLQDRFYHYPEDFMEFYKELNDYDKKRFIERLNHEVKEINDITNQFKERLKRGEMT